MMMFLIFLACILVLICLSHAEPHQLRNLTSSRRQTTQESETTIPKSGNYPQYIQPPYDYFRNFEDLISRSTNADVSLEMGHRNPDFIDLESHQKKLASQHLPEVTVYRLSSPYQESLGYYGGHDFDSMSLKKHDFVRLGGGNQGYFGGWDNFPSSHNMGGHGGGGGGLIKGKEAKALFILMAPLILLAVFGPILATQAMLPWITGGGMTSVSTIAGGKRRKRSSRLDFRHMPEFEKRLQLFLEVQEFIARSGSPELVEEMGEAFMRCQKYTERRNKCLERVACEYTDPTSDLNREERRIGKMVLRNVMSNVLVPASLMGRLKKGLLLAKSQPGRCSNYWCEAIDGPKKTF